MNEVSGYHSDIWSSTTWTQSNGCLEKSDLLDIDSWGIWIMSLIVIDQLIDPW